MPKLAKGLTIKQIDAAKPGKTLADGRGLSLVVDTGGNKRWVFRYTRPDGRRNWIGLGSYPETSLPVARALAQNQRETLAGGIDPAIAKKEAKQQLKASVRGTFKSVGEEWHAHKSKGWASETARKAREVLDDYLYPKIGSKAISELSSADVKPVLLYVHERGPRLAVKARQYVNQIVDYAIQEGLREEGKLLSLKGVLPKMERAHYAAVTKTNDLPSMLSKINSIESHKMRVAVQTLLYTASRPGVVAGMLKSELDLEAGEWHVSARRMKTGNDHITPLPKQLIPLLQEAIAYSGNSPFVFPGERDPIGKHLNRDSISKALREAGLRGVTVSHGFRATFRTIARERLRIDPDVLEAQIAHAKKDEIQAAYDRAQFLEERHQIIQRWADYIDAVQNGAKVIPLKTA
ncbi:tyrosine-type recombinase/integrase [Methylobacillus sp.]|uniref:tyrosine-type recombinase/integrase n=1 Tax=Methylobacillus sp. TaxID=56818 RepID=UPI002FE2A874